MRYENRYKPQDIAKRLPKLWPYDHSDKSTWAYLDVILKKNDYGKEVIHRWVKNPNFRYKDRYQYRD